MRTIKIYGTGSATGNNIANVIIPSASTIRGVQVCISADSITDNAQLDLELSRSSATEIAVNGAQQCIVQATVRNNFVTSGLTAFGVVTFLPCSVPVVQGQIIYLHAVIVGTITYFCTFIIHYD
jgi:hypothetical protein